MRVILTYDIFFKATRKITVAITLAWLLSGCTNYIFRPNSNVYHTPKELQLNYYDVFLKTPDNVQIHGWFLRAKGPSRGTVFVLHGNAQNISAHVMTISWLPASGYNVFIMDYRGYGNSTGTPSIPEVFLDIKTGLIWLNNNLEVQEKPLFLLGQSLGAALGVYFVGNDSDAKKRFSGIILDASFSRYQIIAKEILSENWVTWIFQYIFPEFLSDKYDPEDFIAKISPLPVLIMHSKQDRIIPFNHSKRLFKQAEEPKFFVETEGGHIETFRYAHFRREALEFMSRAAK